MPLILVIPKKHLYNQTMLHMSTIRAHNLTATTYHATLNMEDTCPQRVTKLATHTLHTPTAEENALRTSGYVKNSLNQHKQQKQLHKGNLNKQKPLNLQNKLQPNLSYAQVTK